MVRVQFLLLHRLLHVVSTFHSLAMWSIFIYRIQATFMFIVLVELVERVIWANRSHFFDPDRETDRKIAPELVQKLSEAGQAVPDFLREYTEGGSGGGGFGRGGFGSRNTDMRSDGTRIQAASTSGGTAAAGGASEDWD